jgi:hypothetical protein
MEPNYSKILDLTKKRRISYIYYDRSKIWSAGDKKGELGSSNNLINCLAKILPIYDSGPFFYSEDDLYIDILDENGELCDFKETSAGIENSKDFARINFLNQGIFNYVWLDSVTNNWIIGDFETKTPASYGQDIRAVIDNLIC